MLRRLDPVEDEALLREAFLWDKTAPTWYRDMDGAFGPNNADEFLRVVADPLHILVGIFDSELVGLLILVCAGRDVFNAHLCAKRKVDLNVLAVGANQVIDDFLRLGMKEGFCWVAEKNRMVRKLCATIEMQHEGLVMYKSTYRGRLIKWLRYSVKAEAVEIVVAA